MNVLNNLISSKYFFSVLLGIVLLVYIISQSLQPNLHNLNKNDVYYNNLKPTSEVVISNRLKDSDTLEEDIVNNMAVSIKEEHPRVTPRYHPLLPNSAGASLVE